MLTYKFADDDHPSKSHQNYINLRAQPLHSGPLIKPVLSQNLNRFVTTPAPVLFSSPQPYQGTGIPSFVNKLTAPQQVKQTLGSLKSPFPVSRLISQAPVDIRPPLHPKQIYQTVPNVHPNSLHISTLQPFQSLSPTSVPYFPPLHPKQSISPSHLIAPTSPKPNVSTIFRSTSGLTERPIKPTKVPNFAPVGPKLTFQDPPAAFYQSTIGPYRPVKNTKEDEGECEENYLQEQNN